YATHLHARHHPGDQGLTPDGEEFSISPNAQRGSRLRQTLRADRLSDAWTRYSAQRFGLLQASGRLRGRSIGTPVRSRAILGRRLVRLPELHPLHRKPNFTAPRSPVRARHRRSDILFQADFLYDFFGMLRSWHNARANPLRKKTWKKLDLLLVTSTE